MFTQTDAVRDYVFPLSRARKVDASTIELTKPLGTAFLIGSRGFALTARHVVRGTHDDPMIGLFATGDGGWYSAQVLAVEPHPTEDVAVIQLSGGPWRSFCRISKTSENSAARYRLFGYPDDTTFELVASGRVVPRPDLIYNEGYVRRRFNGALLGIDGSTFYELSQVAGTGASGAPVLKYRPPFGQVMGIYVGEKLNDRATSVSYAVREEAFRDWVPTLLGVPVAEEAEGTPR